MSIDAESMQHDVQEEIVTETKDIHEGELLRTQRAASVNNRSWHTLIPGKRGYSDMQNDEEMDEEIDDHFVQQQQYRRPPPEGPRKRGRPRKFPAGVPPPEFLSKVQQRNMESHDVEYEDERHAGSSNMSTRGVSRSHMVGRGGSTMAGAPPRLAQPGHMRMPPPVGQAAHIASQRLPSLTGGPPKENKPLKVVTLLPNSRRSGAGPARPIVSGIRTLGQPPAARARAPQLPIEKQAEQIINQAVKMGDRLVSGQSLGEFNRLIEQLNSQISTLQDDNRKLNTLYTGLLEFKDNRIKQLETQVERLQTELASSVRNWQAQLLMPEITENENKEQDGQIALQPGVRNRTVVQSPNGNWLITDRYVRENDNGEVTEEIIEQEVDHQTFIRMEQESFVTAEDEQGVHEEVIDEQQLSTGEHQLD